MFHIFSLVENINKEQKRQWFETEFDIEGSKKVLWFVFLKRIVIGSVIYSSNANIVECKFRFNHRWGSIRFVKAFVKEISKQRKHILVWTTEKNKMSQFIFNKAGLRLVVNINEYLKIDNKKHSLLMYESLG